MVQPTSPLGGPHEATFKTFAYALAFAARLHAEQTRKGSDTPYVSHLLAVTAIVLDHGGSENEAIAALLHDAVEDQGGQKTLDEIRAQLWRSGRQQSSRHVRTPTNH